MAPNAHSRLGASSASRWMNCPGSVKLCAGIIEEPSPYAAEGTAAHEICEKCLLEGRNAFDFLGAKIKADGFTFTVDQEMAEAVQLYVTTIRRDILELLSFSDYGQGANEATEDDLYEFLDHKGKVINTLVKESGLEMGIEQRFNLEWLHPDLFGTNDCNVGEPFGLLRVYDYKHGAGVPVSVVDNPQLKYYALGAIGEENIYDYDEVELVVIQPRTRVGDKIQRWRISVEDLLKWAHGALKTAAYATEKEVAPLVPGDKQCRWCKAKGGCSELANFNMRLAAAAFGDEISEPTCDPTPPELLTNEQLRDIARMAPTIKTWLESVSLEVKDRLMRCEEPDALGQKLVRTNAKRAWKDEAAAMQLLMNEFGAGILNSKLDTPAGVERFVRKEYPGRKMGEQRKRALEFVRSHVHKPEGGLTVAPLDDARAAVDPLDYLMFGEPE